MNRRSILMLALVAMAVLAAFEPVTAARAAEVARQDATEARILDWVRAAWPVFILLSSGIVGGVVLALGTRFASRVALGEAVQRLDQHREFITDHNQRIRAIEDKLKAPPTPNELQEDIAEVSERLARVESTTNAIDGRLETQNSYLHTVIERAMRGNG